MPDGQPARPARGCLCPFLIRHAEVVLSPPMLQASISGLIPLPGNEIAAEDIIRHHLAHTAVNAEFIKLVSRDAVSGLVSTIWLMRDTGDLPVPTAEKRKRRGGGLQRMGIADNRKRREPACLPQFRPMVRAGVNETASAIFTGRHADRPALLASVHQGLLLVAQPHKQAAARLTDRPGAGHVD